jgi:hypothetical protein
LLKVALNIINQIKSNVSEEVQDRKIWDTIAEGFG